jgi:hypothetical protein
LASSAVYAGEESDSSPKGGDPPPIALAHRYAKQRTTEVKNCAMAELYRYAAFINYSSKAAFPRRLHWIPEEFNIPAELGRFDIVGGGKKKYLNRVTPVSLAHFVPAFDPKLRF